MKDKKSLMIIIILAVVAMVCILGYIVFTSNSEDELSSEDFDSLIEDLDSFDDLEEELGLDDEELDISFD